MNPVPRNTALYSILFCCTSAMKLYSAVRRTTHLVGCRGYLTIIYLQIGGSIDISNNTTVTRLSLDEP